ncbi:MAG: phosphoglycerate dehydrogenase [Sporolactobacillus sp.]
MNILFSIGKAYSPIRDLFVRRLQALGVDVVCLVYEQAMDKRTIIEYIKDATIYITAVAKADREVIDAAPHLKYIIKTGTGVDNIDVGYATEKGIMVSNAPGANANSVAELVIGLMISLSRTLPLLDLQTKNGQWATSVGFECHGKTLGIIGLGAIGKRVAGYAAAFSMKLLAYTHHKESSVARKLGIQFVSLETLLAESDYILVSTSLAPSTVHLINGEALHLMKQSAFLINISRGALVDEHALFEALRQNKIRGAALDVFEIEPPSQAIGQLDNLIATPHIGGTTLESAYRVADVTVENVRRFVAHQPVLHLLNELPK